MTAAVESSRRSLGRLVVQNLENQFAVRVAVITVLGRQLDLAAIAGNPFVRPDAAYVVVDYVVQEIIEDYCAIIGLNQKDLENQGILA